MDLKNIFTSFSSVGICDHLADKIPAISFLLKLGKSFCILKKTQKMKLLIVSLES